MWGLWLLLMIFVAVGVGVVFMGFLIGPDPFDPREVRFTTSQSRVVLAVTSTAKRAHLLRHTLTPFLFEVDVIYVFIAPDVIIPYLPQVHVERVKDIGESIRWVHIAEKESDPTTRVLFIHDDNILTWTTLRRLIQLSWTYPQAAFGTAGYQWKETRVIRKIYGEVDFLWTAGGFCVPLKYLLKPSTTIPETCDNDDQYLSSYLKSQQVRLFAIKALEPEVLIRSKPWQKEEACTGVSTSSSA